MSNWTPQAQQALEDYIKHLRAASVFDEADPAEVSDDIRRHITEDIAAQDLQVVTADAVWAAIVRLGLTVESVAEPLPTALRGMAAASSPAPLPERPPTMRSRLMAPPVEEPERWFCGVILPGMSILAGVWFAECGNARPFAAAPPLPSGWHVALAALVPLGNAALFVGGRRTPATRLPRLELLTGLVLSMATIFAAATLEFAAMSLVLVFVGIGVLAFGPWTAIFTAWTRATWLRMHRVEMGIPGRRYVSTGFILGLLLFIGVEASPLVTRIGIAFATAESPGTRSFGIRWLQLAGDEALLADAADGHGLDTSSLLVRLFPRQPATVDAARALYFHVTGREREADGVINDERAAGTSRLPRPGGGSPSVQLELAHSQFDSTIDRAGATAYTEWTFELTNHGSWWDDDEGSMTVALPPGSVVSRASLWISGEPREAAFTGVAKAERAYASVRQRKRDPLLVQANGPDEIAVRCFPIPPHESFRARLGITSPLVLDDGLAWLKLPRIRARNFRIGDALRHQIAIESDRPIQARSPLEGLTPWKGTRCWLKAAASRAQFDERGLSFTIDEPLARGAQAWAKDDLGGDGGLVVQSIVERDVRIPSRVILVVDQQRVMKECQDEITRALRRLPADIELSVIGSGTEPPTLIPVARATGAVLDEAARMIGNLVFRGGPENGPAVWRAWQLASEVPGGAVVWVHGATPIVEGEFFAVAAAGRRNPMNPLLYDVMARGAVHVAARGNADVKSWKIVPALGSVEDDLSRLFTSWQPGSKRLVAERRKVASQPDTRPADHATDHLVRLWARDEVDRAITRLGSGSPQPIADLGSRYHLVTPFSSAIVLETVEDYRRNDIEAPDEKISPSIQTSEVPEPEEWALLGVTVVVLGSAWWLWRRQPRWRAA